MELGMEIREGFTYDLEREASRKIIRAIDKWRKGGSIKTAQRRWLFELIQNALDISKERKTALEIDMTIRDNKVIFKHNAGYFTAQEIRALIYAYSTKPYERESEFAGRFATGFLVTHITSRKVNVKSMLSKNGEFYKIKTVINRESESIDEIFEGFSESFNQLNNAVRIDTPPTIFWTEYTYEASDDIGKEAIAIGISEVMKCLPFLFAFNKIRKITINDEEYTNESITKGDITAESVGTAQVWLERNQDVEIAIPLESKSCEITNLSSLPRLYVKGLPLIETGSYLEIPFVINSPRFGTTEDRNTLENIEENKDVIKKAFELYHQLMERVCKLQEIRSLHFLSNFQSVSDKIVSENPLWEEFNNLLKIHIPRIVKNYCFVKTSKGRDTIANVVFPSKSIRSIELQPKDFDRFYVLLEKMKRGIPARDELECWIEVATNLDKEFGDVDGVDINIYSISDLKEEIVKFVQESDGFSTLDDFGKKFDLSDPKQFLISFFELVDDLYERKTIESADFVDYMLLDQSGFIGPYAWDQVSLCIDKDLPEDFKDIVQKIGWKVRQELVSRDFAIYKIVRNLVRNTQDVNKAVEHAIASYSPSDDDVKEEPWGDKVNGWIGLFRWCAQNEKFCKDFPMITKAGKVRMIENLHEEAILIPFPYMNIKDEFVDIYPESRILHQTYFGMGDSSLLKSNLMKYDVFVTHLPTYKKEVTLGWNKLKSVIVEENQQISKVDHKIEGTTGSISVLPFWNEVIGRISEYQERAELLLRFVALHLVGNDEEWDKNQQVKCSCKQGNHTISPSQWLASLKTDAWIPLKIEDNDEEKIVKRMATKESIETLLKTTTLEDLIGTDPEKVTKLLMHFGFDELDLKIKLQSIEKGEPEEQVRKEVSALVDIANLVPGLPDIVKRDTSAFKEAIENLKKSFKQRIVARQNLKIGKNVETIIARILSDQEAAADVKPVHKGIGGDYEFWPEIDEGWDSGLIEIKPYIIEVKFTSGTRVHLSKAQGEMSKEKERHYIILVVENAFGLREQLLLLDTSGNNVPEELKAAITENSHIVESIHKKLGSFPNPDEIEPDIHGYWVKSKLWDDKPDVISWINMRFPKAGVNTHRDENT